MAGIGTKLLAPQASSASSAILPGRRFVRSRHDKNASRNHQRLPGSGPNEEGWHFDANAHPHRFVLVHRSRRSGFGGSRRQTSRTIRRAAKPRRIIPRYFANFQVGFGALSLPRNWHTMSLDALWAELNDPRHRPTPQSTIE